MWLTCAHVYHMSVMIQVRNVPEDLHRRLKSRAAFAGMSLSDYLLREIRQVAERPTLDEFRARLKQRPPVSLSISPAAVIRAERDRE
jgi:antitoxin FitA